MNAKQSILIGFIIRIGFIVYAEIQDKYFNLKYTDIDYSVYTDGAKYVMEGGSPYDRHTYRYTPIIAYLMIPNLYYEAFGKIMFSIIDLVTCLLMKKFINSTFLLNLWIFNPLTIQVSTRGSSDTLVVFLIYWMLYLIKKENYTLSALIYGFVVHLRIYPIIYCLPLYFFIDNLNQDKIFGLIFSKNRIKFTIISASVFLILLILFHIIYPDQFLYQTYLYHFIRKDNRHNFSPYFYFIYLSFESITPTQSMLMFIPQFLIVVLSGIKFYKDLPFALLIQTLGFVAFNKVCTAQYFVWWIALLPLALQNSKMNRKSVLFMCIIWFILEVQWNIGSYFIEIQGYNAFFLMFIQCLAFFMSNIYVILKLINNQQFIHFGKLKLKDS